MRKIPKFWGIHAVPGEAYGKILAALPFILIICVYAYFSHMRHVDNPDDKLLPSFTQMGKAMHEIAFTPDKRNGKYLMLNDTLKSLKRIGIALGISAFAGFLIGMNMGLFRGMSAVLLAVTTFLSIIPPLAILPIIFITFGVDELSKIMILIIGSLPIITLYICNAVSKLPREQITKSLTLGANQLSMVYRVITPQVIPDLIQAIRLNLGSLWIFLIAAEAIASTEGLGYRIFLVRRYLSMDIIIPYVLWITLLGFTADYVLKWVLNKGFGWYVATR